MATVLTGARLAQPLSEAPIAMTVIDLDLIEASSATDVVELLRLVPGFQVARKEGIDTIASCHGLADDFPRHTLTVLASQALANDWTISGSWSYVSDMTWMAAGEAVDRLSRVDAKLAKLLRSPGGDWVWSLNVQNLFDDDHYEFELPDPTVSLPGNRVERRIFLELRYLLR